MIKDKIKKIKQQQLINSETMAYFYGDNVTENEKRAYRVGALNSMDELEFFVERLQLEYCEK
jgi:hypothetical protein